MGIILNTLTSAYYCARRGVHIVKGKSNYMAGLHAFTDLLSRALAFQKDITVDIENTGISYDSDIPDFLRSVVPKGLVQALANRQIDAVQIKFNSSVEDFEPYGTIKYLLRNSFRALALHGIREMSVCYDFSSVGSDMGGSDFTVDGVARITQHQELSNAVQINIEIEQKD